ncbi:Carnitine O-acetyltransferase mitochondrial [Clydaea vesicula]|uniref:Carnitine O-acetyltransferase, mitochondrial n=1 Tax=Clydaea vesicula TaxID=447962 RepID=A0AAD5U337_9FUNG|nr:Carnitine O-acetyltransferase mitochondrial [Clydaea vesicula]
MNFKRFISGSNKILTNSTLQISNTSKSMSKFSTKITYSHQSTLPRLPVPELKETCETYLKSLEPILTNQQYERSLMAVKDFLKPGGKGEELQKLLKDRQNKYSNSSWLIDWWNDYAYMGYRDPIVVWVSYFWVFKDDKFRKDPSARAASIARGAMQFREELINETLIPDSTKAGPLCMDQYRYMFNSTRIPKIPSDITHLADPNQNNHAVVIRKNQFFTIDLKVNGRILSTNELESQFKKIYEMAGTEEHTPLGILTTENRDIWTATRDELLLNPLNKKSLEIIENSVFAICLDDTKPVTREELSRACWHGDGKNRFFDKSLQFIIFDNGKAGFNGEHSRMDATPPDRMCNTFLHNIFTGKFDDGNSHAPITLPLPEKLKFDLTNQKTQIAVAKKNFNELIDKHDLKVCVFEGYGKNLIKKFGVSPDAYAQMAIQLAYFKLMGKCDPTYESAQTKKYLFGRTETCRSVSNESVAWVKAMENPHLSDVEKGQLGRKAIASQSTYMRKAVDGKGVDRHLLGLRLLLKPDEPKPEIFADPAYSRSSHWNLSTSQITSEYYEGYGWGEVVPDGWGCAYMVKNNSLHFNLVSLKLGNETFRHYFHEALNEMKVVFEKTIPELTPKAKL